MHKRRIGQDTCCYRCSRRRRCEAFPTKTRLACSGGPPDSDTCLSLVKGKSKFCTVCPSFKAIRVDDNNLKLFEEPAP